MMNGTQVDEWIGKLRAAEQRAWWREMTDLVDPTDEPLVVVAPCMDATAADLRGLGRALAHWKKEEPRARHVWGLDDLLEGRLPRTPPIYLMAPYPLDRFDECYEPVALVFVASGTEIDEAAEYLYERLSESHGKLACFEHPDAYCLCQR
jgi:hypothetical protein